MGHNLPGGLNDILASDGTTIFMRDFQMHLDSIPEGDTIKGVLPANLKPRIHNTAGYLDDTWAHRTYWQYGTKQGSAYGGWKRPGTSTYSGRIMVRDGDDVYGYGRKGLDNDFRSSPQLGFYAKRDIHLYRASVAVQSKPTRAPAPAKKSTKKTKRGRRTRKKKPTPRMSNYVWQNDCRVHVRSMALAKDKVLIAGTKDILRTEDMSRETIAKQAELLESSEEQYFEIYSKKDGSKIANFKLPGKPIYDGMAIAQGNVFISTEDDEILCFAPRK